MSIKNGVYKLKKRVKNTSGCNHHRLWTSCPHFPPAEGEWEGSPERSLDQFIIVVQDVGIMGRTYQEAMLQSSYMPSGFFIGEVPTLEHFPGFTHEDMDEFVMVWQDHSSKPAPQEFLDALVPVKGKTLEDIRREWSKYRDADPQGRLDRDLWAGTVFQVVEHECRNDPEFRKKFEAGLRRMLIRDSHWNVAKGQVLYGDDGKIDPEKTHARQVRALDEMKQTSLKQYRAFQKHDHDVRERGGFDDDY